jgi:hypothetical protein
MNNVVWFLLKKEKCGSCKEYLRACLTIENDLPMIIISCLCLECEYKEAWLNFELKEGRKVIDHDKHSFTSMVIDVAGWKL